MLHTSISDGMTLYSEEFEIIGQIRKGHGHQGHARVDIYDQFYDHFLKQKFLFIEVDGYKVPFHIVEKLDHRHLIIKLETIDAPEALLPYHQSPIYLLKKDLDELVLNNQNPPSPEDSWIGKLIIDSNTGHTIGSILKVEIYPQQIMAFVDYNSQEIMIPLHDTLIQSIDDQKGEIKMELPEGLLEL